MAADLPNFDFKNSFYNPTVTLRTPPFFMIFCHDYNHLSWIMIGTIRIFHYKGGIISVTVGWCAYRGSSDLDSIGSFILQRFNVSIDA